MSPKYRLEYFNVRGKAEAIRWIFAYANQEYEDVRFEKEDWPAKKKVTQYGKVPILYVDDKPLSQSIVICRYLGAVLGISCDNAACWSKAIGEEIIATIEDLLAPAGKIFRAKLDNNEEEHEKLRKEFVETILPPALDGIEARLKDKTWICCEKVTWMDFVVSCYLEWIKNQYSDVAKNYPAVCALVDRTVSLPAIKKWIAERPQTTIEATQAAWRKFV